MLSNQVGRPARQRWCGVLAALAFIFVTLASARGAAAASLGLAPCAAQEPSPPARIISGVFRVRVVCDRLMLEIPPELFYRDFLVYTEVSQLWSTDTDVVPGVAVDSWVMRVHRRASTMHFEMVDFTRRARRATALERGVEASQLGYLVKSLDIIGTGADGAPIVDVTPLFAADVPGFAQEVRRRFRMVNIDPQRSYIDSVQAFPDNIQVHFFQTWMPDAKELYRPLAPEEMPLSPGMPFEFHTNILLLPHHPMPGRYADDRVGYFSVPFDDYGTELPWRIQRGYIMRYRLAKKDPSAVVSEPVQPIVFYLSPEVPERWRPYIKQGIEDWQRVFEAAGFRKAIVARDAPTPQEDPDWDPGDARYSVVRWAPSPLQNALGPSLVDPRSGEIISSHVIFWHDLLRLIETWYFTQAGAVDPRAHKLPMPDELMGELLRHVVTHEVGHTLGLRHNFKATSAYSVEQLRDPEWTRRWGISASVTSYGRFNYVAQPGDGAALVPNFGPYDFFAIAWGYRPLLVASAEAEWPELDRMAARQLNEPMLRFGGEDDVAQIDPSVAQHVLGSDPIAAADLGLRNVDRVVEFLVPATTRLGRDYSRLAALYEGLVLHRHRQLVAVARLVGGVEETRYQAGRDGPPFKPVDPERARAAVKFLNERAFTTPRRLLDPEVVLRIAPEGGYDPLQGSNAKLLAQLVDPSVFQRLAEASLLRQTNAGYTGADLLRDLSQGLFAELDKPQVEIDLYRRELQRQYVLLLSVGVVKKPGVPKAGERIDDGLRDRSPSPGARPPGRGVLGSELSTTGRDFRTTKDRPSEFRAAVRGAASDLIRRIEAAQGKIRDPSTALHLADLRKQLETAP